MIFLIVVVIGALGYLLTSLTPEALKARQEQRTQEAMAQAKDALLGYAILHRERKTSQVPPVRDAMYGYLPMPDLGEAVNQNTGFHPCVTEGCSKFNNVGVTTTATYVGHLPSQTLGTGPIRDGNGNCLWYAVSGTHQALENNVTMNWDTPGLIDPAAVNNSAALGNRMGHDAPIAMIFAPGPATTTARPATPNTQCGGDYTVSRYLDASNTRGLAITSSDLFAALRKSSYFRTDINSMLDRMVGCLRDQIAAGPGFTPATISGFTGPSDKIAGRIPYDACYDDNIDPRGYYNHYKDMIFVVRKITDPITVSGDNTCAGALLFASQRNTAASPAQSRTTAPIASPPPSSAPNTEERHIPINYLEDPNLASFTTNGPAYRTFSGPSQFSRVPPPVPPATQHPDEYRDIVRCIPASPSLAVVAPPVPTFAGSVRLAAYGAATRTLTLGSADTSSTYGAAAAELFACAWTQEIHAGDSGFRSYFRFRIRRVGEGFTFAVIDGDRNPPPTPPAVDVCGAARQHLGYSGNNGGTPYIQPPKLAIEFDTSRQCNSSIFDAIGRPACTFTEAGNTLSNGRNDPCYTSGCWSGSSMPLPHNGNDNSSHVALVYWGYGSALGQPTQDDNVHDQPGLPMPTDPSSRPGPRNPAPVLPYLAPPTYPDPTPTPGIAPLDRMGITDMSQREFHARIEVTRTFTAPVDAKDGATGVQVKFWIEPHSAKSISAMTYNAGSPPTLTVTVTPLDGTGHGLSTGDIVVIKNAVPRGYDGEYPITVVNANTFTATLPAGTPDPGRYISSMTWADNSFGTDTVTVRSANHGLNSGNSVTIADAIPPEFNGTHTITRIDANTYRFGLELSYEPGDLMPAVAAAKALTPRALALSNTTRPMSQLYPGTTPDTTFNPLVADTATVYDEQTVACGAGCPGGQACGSDNMCYRPSFRNLRLGFTLAERPTSTTTARGQLIEIKDFFTTWLP